MNLSLLQTPTIITSENLIQPDDPRTIQFPANLYGCSKQYNVGRFDPTRVQKRTHSPSEIGNTSTLASLFVRDETKNFKTFRCSATTQKISAFCAQVANDKYHRHDCLDWRTKSMRYPENWIFMIAIILSETLTERMVLN